jgi:hypothetical protein
MNTAIPSDIEGGVAKAHIVIASNDAALLERSATELREVDATFALVPLLDALPAASARCDAVVLFANGYDEASLTARIHELERKADGPVLVVVASRTLSWGPSVERDRLAVLVHETSWSWRLLHTMLMEADEPSTSRPELPFTD